MLNTQETEAVASMVLVITEFIDAYQKGFPQASTVTAQKLEESVELLLTATRQPLEERMGEQEQKRCELQAALASLKSSL